MQTKALVRVTDSGGTYTATAKIGTSKSTRASCTMSAERAAQRAAAKAFGCKEEAIVITPITSSSTRVFWAEEAAKA